MRLNTGRVLAVRLKAGKFAQSVKYGGMSHQTQLQLNPSFPRRPKCAHCRHGLPAADPGGLRDMHDAPALWLPALTGRSASHHVRHGPDPDAARLWAYRQASLPVLVGIAQYVMHASSVGPWCYVFGLPNAVGRRHRRRAPGGTASKRDLPTWQRRTCPIGHHDFTSRRCSHPR